MTNPLSFVHSDSLEFKKVLNKRVNEYFARKGISRNHTPGMVFKTIVMFSIYLVPFFLILTNIFPFGVVLILYFIMGIGAAGVGMSVMHDGNHASYSDNQKVNRLMGLSINMLGADAYNWKIKHNKLHHVFTNIYGYDEDINSRAVLRFAYNSPIKKYHRFQHYYAWIFYSMMSLSMIFGDISKRIYNRRKGLTNIPLKSFRKSMAWLIVSKALYFGIIIVLPLLITSLVWWQVLLGFLVMHLTVGTILSLIFQMAHLVEGPEQSTPDEYGKIGHSLIVHQLKTTADFSKNNRLLSWYVGGLNFQIEHHMFPRICHMHYPAISKIVEDTTREYKLPYYVFDGFGDAFLSHLETLKNLGRVKA